MIFKKYKNLARKRRLAKHFKENFRIGLVAASGFMIAFAWREALLEAVDNFVLKYINSVQGAVTETISAVIITFFAVVVIWLVSRWMR